MVSSENNFSLFAHMPRIPSSSSIDCCRQTCLMQPQVILSYQRTYESSRSFAPSHAPQPMFVPSFCGVRAYSSCTLCPAGGENSLSKHRVDCECASKWRHVMGQLVCLLCSRGGHSCLERHHNGDGSRKRSVIESFDARRWGQIAWKGRTAFGREARPGSVMGEVGGHQTEGERSVFVGICCSWGF